jgi:hypothetical protein
MEKGKANTTTPTLRSTLFLLILPSQFDRERVSSKKHRSEDGRGDVGGEGGDGFMVFLSSLPRGRMGSLAVSSTLVQLSGDKAYQEQGFVFLGMGFIPWHVPFEFLCPF